MTALKAWSRRSAYTSMIVRSSDSFDSTRRYNVAMPTPAARAMSRIVVAS